MEPDSYWSPLHCAWHRAASVFHASGAARPQVHPLGQHPAPGPQAVQPARQRKLRPQDLRLWPGADEQQLGELQTRVHDRVRSDQVHRGGGGAAPWDRTLKVHLQEIMLTLASPLFHFTDCLSAPFVSFVNTFKYAPFSFFNQVVSCA